MRSLFPALVLALCMLLAGNAAPAAAQPLAPAPAPPDAGLAQSPGAQLPLDLRFTDAQGNPVVLRDFFGDRPVVLVLGYYRCPQLCGLLMHGLLEALHTARVPRDSYRVLRVSIDPRETPGDARSRRDLDLAYADFLDGARPAAQALDLRLLTGADPALQALARQVGFRYQAAAGSGAGDAAYAHPAALVVLTPQGRVSRYLPGVRFDPWELRLALAEADDGRIGEFSARVALLCAHIDPRLGRHSETVLWAVRAMALALVAAFAAAWWRLARRRPAGKRQR